MRELYRFLKGSTIVVGCSSGPDSMALLTMLCKEREENSYKIICAHVNHNVRKESKEEQLFLEEYCKQHQIVFESMIIEKYGDDNFHNEARAIRYQFFDEIVHKYQAEYLVTAHHGDDLMETILMRLVRGSSLSGYAGFQKVVDHGEYKIVRPFLSLSKDELLAYDRHHKVPYFLDASNKSDKYTRNRYRKTILPFLRQEDANAHRKFYKFSEELFQANEFIVESTKRARKQVYQDRILKLDRLLELEPFLQDQVLHQILGELYQDDLILITDRHLFLIKQLILSKKQNTQVYLPNDWIVCKSYQTLEFVKSVDQVSDYEIEISSFTYLPNHKHLEIVEDSDDHSNFVCRLSSKEVFLPLIVRTRRLGDKMSVKGLGGRKKVKDIFIDSKLPKKERDLFPIVTDSKGTIVWLPGLKKSKFDKKKAEEYDIIIRYY